MDKILDNKKLGKVGDVLKDNLKKGSKISIASAYFTIYAYHELKRELDKIDELKLLFTEPSFIKENKACSREFFIDQLESEKKLSGNEFEIKMRNELNQGKIASECAEWLNKKAKIKSLKKKNIATTKLFHIANRDDVDIAIQGSSDFTTDGLGYTNSPQMSMNIFTDNISATSDMVKLKKNF